jgi:hypothetical protein
VISYVKTWLHGHTLRVRAEHLQVYLGLLPLVEIP